MHQPIKSTKLPARNSVRRSPLRRGLLFIPLVLVCFGLLPAPKAFGVSPPPDGGYSGNNTAEGTDALFSLTTGVWNSAVGFRALYKNAAGIRNTVVGYQALYNNNGAFGSTGLDNVAIGANALFSNTTGNGNIAIGAFALYSNTTGSNNVIIGNHAALHGNVSDSTIVGDSFSSYADSVSIGRAPTFLRGDLTTHGVLLASVNAEDDIYIGNAVQIAPLITYTSRVHIQAQDAVYVGAVYGNAIAGLPVSINSSGQLGVAASSARFKDEIKPMDKASEAILTLKPVTFRYKHELDPDGIPQFGLVAEEVAKVNPDLVTRDGKGQVYTVRYDAVNAMLLNEFLKEHRKIEKQQATIIELKSTVDQQQKVMEVLTTQLKQQAAQIQKVSAQLATTKPAPQLVDKD
jgi:Chaperone of endosialidase